jgi:hypothetical protein
MQMQGGLACIPKKHSVTVASPALPLHATFLRLYDFASAILPKNDAGLTIRFTCLLPSAMDGIN